MAAFFYLKALHIIFITTWFAGLFYIVRLFIYHREAQDKPEVEKKILTDQFLIMEKRLWYGITWPSCVLTLILGPSLLHAYFPLTDHPFMIVKLIFVLLLFLYHLSCGHIRTQMQQGHFKWSSTALRIWNEVATLFLVAIVFLIVMQSTLKMGYALIGLVIFTMTLMFAIKAYKKIRTRQS